MEYINSVQAFLSCCFIDPSARPINSLCLIYLTLLGSDTQPLYATSAELFLCVIMHLGDLLSVIGQNVQRGVSPLQRFHAGNPLLLQMFNLPQIKTPRAASVGRETRNLGQKTSMEFKYSEIAI